MRFVSEDEAVAELIERLAPDFQFIPEVHLRHFDGATCRIDFIAAPRPQRPAYERFGRWGFIGVEVKVGCTGIGEFCKALKQCIDYCHCYINDKRATRYASAIPQCVFLWPDWQYQKNEDGYSGAVRLAGHYNVGIIRQVATPWYLHQPGYPSSELEFRVSDTAIWRSHRGLCGPREFGTARRRGAA